MAREQCKPTRQGKPPKVDWEHTGIHGTVKRHTEYNRLIHVAEVEDALAIVRRGKILPYPERECDNVLYCKPIEVTWLSPTRYMDSVFGSVAFHFDWSVLHGKYGKKIYGLHEVEGQGREGRPTWKSRILFAGENLPDSIGEPYDLASPNIPWKKCENSHFLKHDCDCQIGVMEPINLVDLHHIEFVNHKSKGGGGRNIKLYRKEAERLFLAKAVYEYLPCINGFRSADASTNRVSDELLHAWSSIWSDIWNNNHFEYRGSISPGKGIAETLARCFLDRYGRVRPRHKDETACFAEDAKNIASQFRSAKSLILSLRRVIARWAGVKKENLDCLGWGWPPW